MMISLPVREMVLYKHGVGYFVREGAVSGGSVALSFRQDEINDVLKSLAVFDRAGGQVLGIHYQTPMDQAARLANSSIRLSDFASLRDLIRDLRGRRAALAFETTPGTIGTVTGRVIGLDRESTSNAVHISADGKMPDALISILTDDGQVRVFPFDALRSLNIEDAQSGHDLTYFLDTAMGEETRRTVNVRLSEGEHDLFLSYVAPSPTWRVSYRIVADSDETGETGKALLQGWGLFDNRLEEDLEDVRVTLVAGQPISFIYDLYASRIPERPTVQDEARIVPGPVEYQGAISSDFAALAADTERLEEQVVFQKRAAPAPQRAMMSRKEMAEAAPPVATTKETGEFFQYVVTNPVSVKRGESALVPIISSEVSYARELLYNGAKLPDHPVAALRFENVTGLTLERGPVTVVEDGDYKGEAVVSFTRDGNQIYLPYAVELGVAVTERLSDKVELAGLSIEDIFLVYEEYQVQVVTYALENTTAKPITVTIEATVNTGLELFETPAPDIETASERRWRVSVPARGRAEFTRKERRLRRRHQELRRLDYQNLQHFFKNRWIDQEVFDRLTEMLVSLGSIQRAQARQSELASKRSAIHEQQEQLRANLNTLQPTGQESAFRNRLLGHLEGTQNRLDEIDQQQHDLVQQIAEAEARIDEIIASLGQKK